MSKYIPRQLHNYGNGRVDVVPFKLPDFNNMTQLCIQKRDKYDPKSKQYMRWYRNYMMLILGCNTGCRIEVLLQLTPKHLKGNECRITEYKTNKTFRYELNSKVYAAVNRYINYLEIGDNDYIFKTDLNSDRPLSRIQAYRIIQGLAKTVGIKYNVGCHSLRKSFGRFIYDETHDIHIVQKLLGHSNPLITQQYICIEEGIVSKRRKKAAYGVIE